MRSKTDDTGFIRFLKDEKFIEWKLLPTDELNVYWENYLQRHPDERENVLLADKYLQRINLSSYKMPQEKKKEAILRLEQSLGAYKHRRNIRRFVRAAAACVAVLILSLLYIQKEMNRSGQKPTIAANYITGNELESEDILFITGNRTTSFQSNVDIHLDGSNTAQIKSENTGSGEIFIEQHTMNKLIVPYGKRSKIVLSDGTQVWLNSGSSLEFPSSFSGEKREIFLSGEMYIEVTPDENSSFYVHISNFDVKVHGTKFNISSYAESTSSVVLVEGSIGLQTTDREELLLLPDEQAIYNNDGTFEKRKVNVDSFVSWKEGYLTFDDTPVTEVLKQIERYYNLSFNYDNNVSFQGLTCTGKIILSDNLDNVMTALTLISTTKYKKENKLIYIYKEL
jgi:ferric-dicitrate binding protein FerR (iron transport regulator)